MLLLELICFDSDCDFEEPPTKWSLDLMMSRLCASPLGPKLRHLQDEGILQMAEDKRLGTHELAQALGVSTPPRVKERRPVNQTRRQLGESVFGLLGGVESWLRRAIVLLWVLCIVHVALVSFGLTGLLVGDAGVRTSLGGWLRLGTRFFLTVGAFLGAVVPLSTLAFAERRDLLIGLPGCRLKMPARPDLDRPELVHLGIVTAQLLGILAVLATVAFVVAGW